LYPRPVAGLCSAGLRCPAARCTSSSEAPFSNAELKGVTKEIIVHNVQMNPMATSAFGHLALEIGESAFLSCFEPNPVSSCNKHELPRIRKAILRARDGKLARFRHQVNRNVFLLGCLEYTEKLPEEHLLIGYGFRYGSTTKVEGVHHVIGMPDSVRLPGTMAHAMWDYYLQHETNELLIFHNHPFNPLNFLFDNLPLASRMDRCFLQARSLNPEQLVRWLLDQGRVLFYLGENGFVKEFRVPSIVTFLGRFPVVRVS
jgi:hypothetical protein